MEILTTLKCYPMNGSYFFRTYSQDFNGNIVSDTSSPDMVPDTDMLAIGCRHFAKKAKKYYCDTDGISCVMVELWHRDTDGVSRQMVSMVFSICSQGMNGIEKLV